MGEIASTKLLLSTTRPGPFIGGSSHAILTLGQRPIIGGVLCEASWLAAPAHVAGGILRSTEYQWCLLMLQPVSPHCACAHGMRLSLLTAECEVLTLQSR